MFISLAHPIDFVKGYKGAKRGNERDAGIWSYAKTLAACYTNVMKNSTIISPKRPNDLAKRIFIISFSIIGALCIILIITLVITNANPKYMNTGGSFEPTYHKYDNLSEMLNLYSNLPDELPEDYLYTILDRGEINRDNVHINAETGEGYIAKTPIDINASYPNQDIEFISFSYTPGDEESTVAMIDDITFNSYRNNRHDFIRCTAEGEYTHSDGEYTNTYENKSYAIDSYLMTR